MTYSQMNKQTPLIILIYSPFATVRSLVLYAVGTREHTVLSIDNIKRAKELLRLSRIDLAILDTEGMSENSLVEVTRDDSVSIVLLQEEGNEVLKSPPGAVRLTKPFTMGGLFAATRTALLLQQQREV